MARESTGRSQSSVMRGLPEIKGIVRWYFTSGRVGGVPFYCDPTRIGAFAIEPDELSTGSDAVVFKLFVTLSMYQALRDVVIMKRQRSLPTASARLLVDVATVKRSIKQGACSILRSAEAFDQGCDVRKDGDYVDCGKCAGAACHVKDSTRAFNRMGDMGKLPTSAWLRLWGDAGVRELLRRVCQEESTPTKRAAILVERFSAVHRVGRKLATLFVSALSTPSLAPGLTPWFPEIDGNELVVVDTNVACAIDALRTPRSDKSYDARARWLRERAARIDLRGFQEDLPAYSPRLVQEALYAFCSKSNRVAGGDRCAALSVPCTTCTLTLCPFAGSD